MALSTVYTYPSSPHNDSIAHCCDCPAFAEEGMRPYGKSGGWKHLLPQIPHVLGQFTGSSSAERLDLPLRGF